MGTLSMLKYSENIISIYFSNFMKNIDYILTNVHTFFLFEFFYETMINKFHMSTLIILT
jgi:hypothetical protein